MDNDHRPPKPAASIATRFARAAKEPEEHGPDAMWRPIDSGPTTGAASSPSSWMRQGEWFDVAAAEFVRSSRDF